jgi:hypothetical protein
LINEHEQLLVRSDGVLRSFSDALLTSNFLDAFPHTIETGVNLGGERRSGCPGRAADSGTAGNILAVQQRRQVLRLG